VHCKSHRNKGKMKKIVAIAITCVTLASCGTKTIVVEKAPDTTPAPVQPEQKSSFDREENFLNGLTYDHPTEVSKLGKTGTVELGRLTCGSIDEGSTINDFVDMANRSGVSAEFIGSLIREAVENFCPENQWFIDSALNANL
jgi:hypothetical protein